MGAGVRPEPLSAIASIAAKMDAFNSKSLSGIAAMTAKFDAANNKSLGSIASIAAKMDAFNSKSLSGIAAMTAKMDGFAPKSLDAIMAKMDDIAGAKAQSWTEKFHPAMSATDQLIGKVNEFKRLETGLARMASGLDAAMRKVQPSRPVRPDDDNDN
jgi:hypothetical protein